ncbi:glycosyltransferase family 4 protein [Synechococcus sp. KORDI-100]|uniref:glycosyltransferase family 4 protein n=1 Tax=Synechococcus sp. KORDI-100 TaxID=1280380 RepID=UPI0005715EEE|nr:glycosyltransferase family 4 protein [Synechococcus sp. KORDI-100]
MKDSSLRLVLISTPIGALGSGRGGGVELTLRSLVQGLVGRQHQLTLVAPRGSERPQGCDAVELLEVDGVDQPSWQHASEAASVEIPRNAVLPRLLDVALQRADKADALLNFGYDWLPLWITPHIQQPLFHLISMGAVTTVMGEAIEALGRWDQRRLAFHTARQASDFTLPNLPCVVGNGFDLQAYRFQPAENGPLGWAGRIAPEKGLEDAAAAAAALGDRLLVWGLREDEVYAAAVESAVPPGTIEWRGFLSTEDLQRDLGACRALINTPKWNEAYGNVVVEAMACGVPVIAYDRGGPGELIVPGENGLLVPPDDVSALAESIRRCGEIDRYACRHWAERHASQDVFSGRVEAWIRAGLAADGNITAMQ